MSENVLTSNPDADLIPREYTQEEFNNFQGIAGEYKGLAFVRNEKEVAYLCMELPPGVSAVLHLWLPEENRNAEFISWLRQAFYNLVHPWVKAHGKQVIVVTCHYDLIKTKELFKTFGFNPKPIWLGAMPVE